jgi:transcriptional regulator with PAS, ATPase and Fis domain
VFLREPINKSVYVKCRAVTNEGSIIGMVITIFESKIVQRLVNRVSNNSAYFIFEDLIGCSPCFQTSKEIAKTAAESSSNVLIVGESGTGKELFAQAIHNGGSRHSHPFISINCAAIPRELIGSELFGYVEGAFTGARKSGAPGKFEIADKGTIFLDEIGEMPLDMQAVLLRVLEEKRVTRLGGSISAPIDVRVIAATNKNLWELVKTNAFRMDLFYRLNVLRLEIPPLRERKDDIPLLIEHFIKQFNASLHKNITDYEPEAKNFLQQYTWPGNIRELRNIVERCVNLSKSSMLTIHDLPRELLPSATENKSETPPATDPYEKKLASKFTLEMNEKLKIADLLRQYNYNKSRVAHELGISRVTLYKKLKEMGL